jgi:glycerol-1-phosphate dehydrogenase [NAD(P)+]
VIIGDTEILSQAPMKMLVSGLGDMIAKYVGLVDWQISTLLTGEVYCENVAKLTRDAVDELMEMADKVTAEDEYTAGKIFEALLKTGIGMSFMQNSRPASGSEHHQSHFLEMDFVRRGEKIPLHGWKVGLGTLVSIEIYKQIKDRQIGFSGCETAYRLAEELPSVARVEEMLAALGCPTRFSQIGVRRETMEDMLEHAHTVRDRYTVLTLANELDLMKNLKPILMEKYF